MHWLWYTTVSTEILSVVSFFLHISGEHAYDGHLTSLFIFLFQIIFNLQLIYLQRLNKTQGNHIHPLHLNSFACEC